MTDNATSPDFKIEFEGDIYGEAMFLHPGDLKILNVTPKYVYVKRIKNIKNDSITYRKKIEKIYNYDGLEKDNNGYLILREHYINKIP